MDKYFLDSFFFLCNLFFFYAYYGIFQQLITVLIRLPKDGKVFIFYSCSSSLLSSPQYLGLITFVLNFYLIRFSTSSSHTLAV